jgi:glycosyltransferase involved in cell wall biosynthesis
VLNSSPGRKLLVTLLTCGKVLRIFYMKKLLQTRKSSLRFVVIQMGARMHYAVPALLERAGMLEQLYTDICGNLGSTIALQYLWPESIRPKAVKRLLGRKLPPEVPHSSVTTCAGTAILNTVLKRFNSTGKTILKPVETEDKVRQQVLKDQFLNANALYTLINSDIAVVRKAKECGLLVVHEQILNPNVGHIIREERSEYPGIEKQDSLELIEEGIQRDRQQWAMSDLILAPSSFVSKEIVKMGGSPERIALVPYGIDEEWLVYQPNPQRGRVLFVGTVGLRKGNHYLAEATRILQKRGVQCQVRVVGPYDPEAIKKPEFQGPIYVGQVPRTEVMKEFLSADIFVLPTLSDSFALVHLEALACGLPVITTPNCGSVVRDGMEGFIVPIRDAQTLADRMEQLLIDTHMREKMSQKARERAREFTWKKYGERLINALKNLENKLN